MSWCPSWFDVSAVAGPIVLLAVGCAALALAMAGWYSMWVALAVGVPLGAAAVFAVARALHRPWHGRRTSHWWAVGAVVIAVTAFAWNGLRPAQHVILEADPGGYTATARWISRDGSLVGDLPAGPFLDHPKASVEVPGVYSVGDGAVEFQFNHLTAAALAVAFDAGGSRAMFRLPALAGALALLPLYSIMARLTGRPWLGAVGVVALATSLPFVGLTETRTRSRCVGHSRGPACSSSFDRRPADRRPWRCSPDSSSEERRSRASTASSFSIAVPLVAAWLARQA